MKEDTILNKAEAWAGRLNPHEKKRVFGGQNPKFDGWWKSLTNVDKVNEYNKWKGVCPGTKAVAKAKPKPKKEPPKKKAPAKGKGKGKKK